MLVCPYCKEKAKHYTYCWANQHGYKKRWFFECGRWVDETLSYVRGFTWVCLPNHQCKLLQPPLPLPDDKLSQYFITF